MDEIILTYDIGTTACKTVAFDLNGNELAVTEKEYPMYHAEPLWAEQDPDDWWNAVVETTSRILALPGVDASRVAAIGLSSQRETVVPVDGRNAKLRNAIVWLDRRSRVQADRLIRDFGWDRLHALTGMVPDATFTVTKLLWHLENEPELVEKADCFLQPKEYIALRLTGERHTEPSLASRTMMWNVRTQSWADEIFDYAGLPKTKLPPVRRSDEIIGRVSDEAARMLGLKAGVPVVAGGGDRQCEALGAGVYGGRAMESTGTTSNVSFASDRMVDQLDRRVVCSSHVIPGYWLFEQGLTTTGSILRWYRDNFSAPEVAEAKRAGLSAYDVIASYAAESPAGAKKLLMLPFFMGAKSTRWNPSARGVFFGATLDHNRADFARSIMEGVSFEILACLRILEGMKLKLTEIVAIGGGSRGEVWNQIKADVTGREYKIPKVTNAASLGAMILTSKAIGVFDCVIEASRHLTPVVKTYVPDPDKHQIYLELFEVYQKLYAAVEPLFADLEKCGC